MAAPPNIVAHKPHFHRNEAWKQPVRVATTAAGTLASSFENGDTVDGETLVTGDRLLVKDQADATENGIYVVAASGAPTRAFDMDAEGEFVGAVVLVMEGTQAGTLWRCTVTTAVLIDTDDVTWEEVAAADPPPSPATTVESETTFGIAAAVGTDTEYARQDHTHGSPANPVSAAAISTLGFVGQLLISDTPSTPLVFADILQNEATDDLIYADL